ncbi:hypothetical protein RhiTH_010454 [Rhizoctonia solani]
MTKKEEQKCIEHISKECLKVLKADNDVVYNRSTESSAPGVEVETQEATTAATTSSKDPVVMELLDEANKWEEEWELDAVIEQLEPSSKYSFEIRELDGIDLSSLVLLDLLSDDPVKGVNIGSAGKRKEVQKSGQENLVVSLLKFQF